VLLARNTNTIYYYMLQTTTNGRIDEGMLDGSAAVSKHLMMAHISRNI
jgi:hypothetical protein